MGIWRFVRLFTILPAGNSLRVFGGRLHRAGDFGVPQSSPRISPSGNAQQDGPMSGGIAGGSVEIVYGIDRDAAGLPGHEPGWAPASQRLNGAG
jgi:hypothetical protein